MFTYTYSNYQGVVPYVMKAAIPLLLLSPLVGFLCAILLKLGKKKAKVLTGDIFEGKVKRYIKKSFGVQAAQSVILPLVGFKTTEIDLIAVVPQGILCIECKERRGKISGVFTEPTWNVENARKGSDTMGNPIKQNVTHIRAIRDYFAANHLREVPIYNVAIVKSPKLEVIAYEDYDETFLFKNEKELDTIKRLPACLDAKEQDILNAMFRSLQSTKTEKEAHVLKLKRMGL